MSRQVRVFVTALMLTGWSLVSGPSVRNAAAQASTAPALAPSPAAGDMAGHAADEVVAAGYVEREFFLEGTAYSYVKQGEWTSDGVWTAAPGTTAAYKIRVIARYPAQASRFNGIAFVEWLNVSGGSEGAVNWTMLRDELVREGYAYVGIGAQAVGVAGIKKANPQRYASLVHPGDSYSYDIFSQGGRLVRSTSGPLAPIADKIRYVLADGQSQSASRMVTYVNAVHPLAQVFDGFFIHSRSGGGTPLTQDASNKPTIPVPSPARIRTDLTVPVMVVQAETDVPNFISARQPDTPRLRTWEMAGTAHAEMYQLTGGGVRPLPFNCDDRDPSLSVPISDGPSTYPLRAALRHTKRWLGGGAPPPSAPPLASDGNMIRRDPATGLALGGVRTPEVDVPTRTLNGVRVPAGGPGFCFLFGRTDEWNGDKDPWDGGSGDPSPTPEPVLARLYRNKDDYLAKYERALNALVKAGFLLKADVPALRQIGARLWPETSRPQSNR